MIISAGAFEQFSFATPIGIGSSCAIKLSEQIILNKPKRLIFVGSMGLYTKSIELFSIHNFTNATNIELSSLDDLSYTPLDFAKASLNSSNYICKDFSKASILHDKYKLLGENMECFYVFECARYFNVPTQAYLIATNYCDDLAHEQYMQNYQKSCELLENFLENKGII